MFFNSCHTLDELKKEYRRLAMIHHPDRGGDTVTMQRINDEYAARFEVLKNQHNATADEAHQTTETPEEFTAIINALINLDGLEIELCGSWVWIGGNTYAHRAALKELGCLWASKKRLWYWRHPEDATGHHKPISMERIRELHGSQTFTSRPVYLGA